MLLNCPPRAQAYVLVYFASDGHLPWMCMKAANKKQKYERIFEKKASTRPEWLCKGLPSVFERYLVYCKGLEFADRPNYARWVREFKDAAGDWGVPRIFDWEERKKEKKTKKAPDGRLAR